MQTQSRAMPMRISLVAFAIPGPRADIMPPTVNANSM